MKLLVGLGNPGAKYEENRHNIGFKVIDKILKLNDFSDFKSKFQGHFSEGRVGGYGDKVLLLKPQTYMNESGRSVQALAQFYKIDPERIIAFHDELDLVPGKMRVKFGGGHAGHNGLRSMQAHLGVPDFWRVRLGIGHPGHKDMVSPYVLSDFAKAEREMWVDDFVDALARKVDLLLQGQEEDYMTQVARLSPVLVMNEKDDT
jgi:PTH1 family peptidyl-tRNA hydrolase